MIRRVFSKDVYETKYKGEPESNFYEKIVTTKKVYFLGVKLVDTFTTEMLHPTILDSSEAVTKKKKAVGFSIENKE